MTARRRKPSYSFAELQTSANPPCRRFLQTAATQYDDLQPEAVNPRCRTVVVSRGYAHPQKPSRNDRRAGAARQHERYRATVARFVAPSP
jgi:hypothetical protein